MEASFAALKPQQPFNYILIPNNQTQINGL